MPKESTFLTQCATSPTLHPPIAIARMAVLGVASAIIARSDDDRRRRVTCDSRAEPPVSGVFLAEIAIFFHKRVALLTAK
jgi:hypothetical protein